MVARKEDLGAGRYTDDLGARAGDLVPIIPIRGSVRPTPISPEAQGLARVRVGRARRRMERAVLVNRMMAVFFGCLRR